MSEELQNNVASEVKKLKDSQLALKKSIEEKTQLCGELCLTIQTLPNSILKTTLLGQLDECIIHVHTLMEHNKALEVELTDMLNSLGVEYRSY